MEHQVDIARDTGRVEVEEVNGSLRGFLHGGLIRTISTLVLNMMDEVSVRCIIQFDSKPRPAYT